MWSIVLKEVQSIFNDAIGYLSIGVFLLLNSLFLWVLDGSFNIVDAGFADLTLFFELAPWLLLLVVPALGMRSFSEEIKSGTIELLLTKPVDVMDLVIGKFLGVFFVGFLAVIPTLGYLYLLEYLTPNSSNLDYGMLIGGYIGLLLYLGMLSAICVFMSSISKQQTIAFLLSLVFGFCQFYLWEQLAKLTPSFTSYEWIASVGMISHYSSLNRGVILSGDVAYFIGGTLIFLIATRYRLVQIQAQ